MKLKKKISKVILIVFILFICSINVVDAAINESYYVAEGVAYTDVAGTVEEDSLLGILGRLVYTVGLMLEWLLSIIFEALTGSSDFPWADKIVFNAVPLLDVNFINPANHSFVGNRSIQGVLKNLYSTILAIASSFFGIVVMITALKLLLSTIASDKAKYKKAIVDWLVGFVMMFCIHFGMSFMFYLNEQLVEVASKIVTARFGAEQVRVKAQVSSFAQDILSNMGDEIYEGPGPDNGKKVKDILEGASPVLEAWTNLSGSDSIFGLHHLLMYKYTGLAKTEYVVGFEGSLIDEYWQRQRLALIVSWAMNSDITIRELHEIRNNKIIAARLDKEWDWNEFSAQIMDIRELEKIFGQYWEGHMAIILQESTFNRKGVQTSLYTDPWTKEQVDDYIENTTSSKAYYDSLSSDTIFVASRGFNSILITTDDENSWWDDNFTMKAGFAFTDILDELITLKSYAAEAKGEESETSAASTRLISNLATFFKTNAYERKIATSGNITGATKTGNIYVQNMIMFAILVAQSLILFIAYIKRLFYVILLSMMAPVVVVFDFFQRFGK